MDIYNSQTRINPVFFCQAVFCSETRNNKYRTQCRGNIHAAHSITPPLTTLAHTHTHKHKHTHRTQSHTSMQPVRNGHTGDPGVGGTRERPPEGEGVNYRIATVGQARKKRFRLEQPRTPGTTAHHWISGEQDQSVPIEG
jgi:hypothetical protein